MLVIGWIALGAAAWEGSKELIAFAMGVSRARTTQDIDRAADHLARAIGLLGIQAVLGLMLRARPETFPPGPGWERRDWYGRWHLGSPPVGPLGSWAYKPTARTVPPETLPEGAVGATSAWGDIEISSALSEEDARATLLHEKIHSILTPKLYISRKFRAQYLFRATRNPSS